MYEHVQSFGLDGAGVYDVAGYLDVVVVVVRCLCDGLRGGRWRRGLRSERE